MVCEAVVRVGQDFLAVHGFVGARQRQLGIAVIRAVVCRCVADGT